MGRGECGNISVFSLGEDFTLSSIEFNCAVDVLYEDVSFETESEQQ